jgi:hypothetical protein
MVEEDRLIFLGLGACIPTTIKLGNIFGGIAIALPSKKSKKSSISSASQSGIVL